MNVRRIILMTAALAVVSPVFAQFTGDGFKNKVVGSLHDLGSNPDPAVSGQITGSTAVCEFCHAPHKIPGFFGGVPTGLAGGAPPLLWNLQIRTVTYPVYGNSPVLAALDVRSPSVAGPTKQASYMSLLCMSCHDGGIAASSFYYTDVLGTIGTIGANVIPNIGNSGGDGLANDHPVDFTYSAALAASAGGLQTPTEGAAVRIPYVGKTTPFPLFKDQPTDTSGRVECATCHNPHDNTLNPQGYFQRMNNTRSAVCLNCHGN